METENQSPVIESEQIFSTEAFAGAIPRFLKGDSWLNPDTTIATIEENDFLPFEERDYSVFTKASNQERKDHWQEYSTQPFSEQKNVWADKTSRVFQNSHAWFSTDITGQRWNSLFTKIGIDAGTFDTSAALTVFNTYFDESGENANIKEFVKNILDAHKSDDGIIDQDLLAQNQDAIVWLSKIFGSQSAEITTLLATGEALLSTAESKKQLIDNARLSQKVNEENTMRINNLSPKEKQLLSFLSEHAPSNLQGEVEESTVIEEDIQVPEPDTSEPEPTPPSEPSQESSDDQEESYRDRVSRLINMADGRPTDEHIDLSESYPALVQQVKDLMTKNESLFTAEKPTIVLSPEAKIILEDIAEESNRINKELPFVLRGIRISENGKDAYIVAFASPAYDYTLAQTTVSRTEPRFETPNAKQLTANLGLSEYFQQYSPSPIGAVLLTCHTHQEQLGDIWKVNPSRQDYNQIESYVHAHPTISRSWGVITKWRGNVLAKVFTSKKVGDQIIHQEVGLLSTEDIQKLQTYTS